MKKYLDWVQTSTKKIKDRMYGLTPPHTGQETKRGCGSRVRKRRSEPREALLGLVAGKQLREASCGGEEAEMVVWGGRGEWTWEAMQQREESRSDRSSKDADSGPVNPWLCSMLLVRE